MLSKEEKEELKELSKSYKLRENIQKLAKNRYNPFGKVNLDKFIAFLTEYNYFINHSPRCPKRIIGKDIRL